MEEIPEAAYEKLSAELLIGEAEKGQLKLIVNTSEGKLSIGVWLYGHIANYSFLGLLNNFTEGLGAASLRDGSHWCNSIATDLERAALELRLEAQRLSILENRKHLRRSEKSTRKTIPVLGDAPLSIGRAFENRDRRLLRKEFRREAATALRFLVGKAKGGLKLFFATVRSFINPEVN